MKPEIANRIILILWAAAFIAFILVSVSNVEARRYHRGGHRTYIIEERSRNYYYDEYWWGRSTPDSTIINGKRATLSGELINSLEEELQIDINSFTIDTSLLVGLLLKIPGRKHRDLIRYLWNDYIRNKDEVNRRLPERLRTQ